MCVCVCVRPPLYAGQRKGYASPQQSHVCGPPLLGKGCRGGHRRSYAPPHFPWGLAWRAVCGRGSGPSTMHALAIPYNSNEDAVQWGEQRLSLVCCSGLGRRALPHHRPWERAGWADGQVARRRSSWRTRDSQKSRRGRGTSGGRDKEGTQGCGSTTGYGAGKTCVGA